MCHATFILCCHFRQCALDIGSAPVERVGQIEGGGQVSALCRDYMHMAASGLGCRKSPWLALGGPFLSSFVEMDLENSLLGLHLWQYDFFLGGHWPRAVTIESLLRSGCGQSHEFVQHGCNDTCVKLGASNPT